MMSSKDTFEKQNSFDDDLQQIHNEYDQLLLKQSALEHAQKQAELFPLLTDQKQEIPEHDFSQLDNTFSSLLKEQQKQRHWLCATQKIKNFSKRVAVFLVVAMAGFTALFFSVDAVKLNVVNLIVRSYEKSTQFCMEDMFGEMPQEIPPLNESDFRIPKYIPARFEEVSYQFSLGHGSIIYETENSPYILSYNSMEISSSILLDTEDCISESVSIGGHDALLYTKYRGEQKGNTSLIWHDEQYIYLISGPVRKNEIIKIAESLY